MSKATVYLIPSLLSENETETIPLYITKAIKECQVFFTENERTTRRYLKLLWRKQVPDEEIIIDNYEWYVVNNHEANLSVFKQKLDEGKTIGIFSEAGCPGIADPGQMLIALAHKQNAVVKPLVGPSSILLALMASGMNGQQFSFHGYLPVKDHERNKAIRELETESAKKNCTQIFIETPYRNNQLFEALIKNCKPSTLLCIAADLTSSSEWIKTTSISEWKNHLPVLHKRPVIFLLQNSL